MMNLDVAELCKQATRDAFKGKVNMDDLNKLLDRMPVDGDQLVASNALGVPDPIEASASLVSAVIWSKVKCYPQGQPWKFEENAWGPGIGGGESIGFMYTAYDSWDAFFHNATAYHAQGIAATGGIFQINWFNSDGVPIGQFNGALGGAGAFEIGGSGKWQRT